MKSRCVRIYQALKPNISVGEASIKGQRLEIFDKIFKLVHGPYLRKICIE
jgi:hypothetical protein